MTVQEKGEIMPKINFKDCIYCKGKGFTYTDKMYKKECSECMGTGSVEAKEKRMSILVEYPLHVELTEIAHDLNLSLVGLMRKVAKDYG